ncbi:MAG: hypothetical protein GY854_02470 [Deltaproteobacteria bacterium]|nr:hypothetical protein [Deltaproteobacteria bacterium]
MKNRFVQICSFFVIVFLVFVVGCVSTCPDLVPKSGTDAEFSVLTSIAVELAELQAEIEALKAIHQPSSILVERCSVRIKEFIRQKDNLQGLGHQIDACEVARELIYIAAISNATKLELKIDHDSDSPKVKAEEARSKHLGIAANDFYEKCYLEE